MEFKYLIGFKIINSFYDGDSIYLQGPDLIYQLFASTVCCATCYINHINGSEALDNAEILAIENLEGARMPGNYAEDDVIEEWGHRFITTKGICNIEMRLEHNGYYGGELDFKKIEKLPDNLQPLKDF